MPFLFFCVQARSGDRVAPARLLRQSTRMGEGKGHGLPLAWCMAYDPIVDGVAHACGVEDPTFVDDLARLTRGVGRTPLGRRLLCRRLARGRPILLNFTHARILCLILEQSIYNDGLS